MVDAEHDMSQAKGTILLVDDDPGILLTIGDQLRLEGYEVTRADSGRKGLASLQEIRPDCIILDMNMPESGGLAFLNSISKPNGTATYPVLILTARSNMERFFKDTDVAGFLSKSADPSLLLTEVARIVSGQGRMPTPPSAARRVLIAEDDSETAQEISECLSSAGFGVVVTANGYDLIEGAVLQRPGVVVLKHALPHLNGPTIASMLATMPRTRTIKVVCYSVPGMVKKDHVIPHVHACLAGSQPEDLVNAVRALCSPPPPP